MHKVCSQQQLLQNGVSPLTIVHIEWAEMSALKLAWKQEKTFKTARLLYLKRFKFKKGTL